MKFYIKGFFSKFEQIRSFMGIHSHMLKISLKKLQFLIIDIVLYKALHTLKIQIFVPSTLRSVT